MLKKLNTCDYYIITWIAYYMQGILYPHGIINQLLQFIMTLWALIVTIKSLNSISKSSFLKVTFYLVLMYCIYGGWIILFGDNATFGYGGSPNDYTYLQSALNSILPIYLFYYYTRKGMVNANRIIKYSIIFILVSIILFSKNKENILAADEDLEEITNNMGYLFVSILPLLYYFNKRPILQFVLLAINGTFILMGMKRGAIIIGALSIIFLLYSNYKSAKRKKKIIITLLSIIVVITAYYYILYMMQTSDYFVKRIEQTIEGDSSSRNIIFTNIWNKFINENNIFYFLFGRGANATIRIAGNYAHNDWLEVLINNGVLGGFILLSFFVVLAITIYKQRHRFPPNMYYSFLLTLFISFTKTIFSMSIQDLHLSQTLILGYCVYWSTRSKEEIERQMIK